MKNEFDIYRDVWGPYMTLVLNVWSATVFKPIQQLEQLGIQINQTIGELPDKIPRLGNIIKLTKDGLFFKQGAITPADAEKVKYFDLCAGDYDMATLYFKSFFLDRAFEVIRSQVFPNFYILDIACGTGNELPMWNGLVPDGEVIGLDLSEKMIKLAYRNTRLKKLKNVGFYQGDVAQLPVEMNQHFNIIICALSLHYFEEPEKALDQFYQALQKNGKLILIEPIGSFSQNLSNVTLKNAIPHFQKFYNYEETTALIKKANLQVVYWEEIQKDIGLTIAVK